MQKADATFSIDTHHAVTETELFKLRLQRVQSLDPEDNKPPPLPVRSHVARSPLSPTAQSMTLLAEPLLADHSAQSLATPFAAASTSSRKHRTSAHHNDPSIPLLPSSSVPSSTTSSPLSTTISLSEFDVSRGLTGLDHSGDSHNDSSSARLLSPLRHDFRGYDTLPAVLIDKIKELLDAESVLALEAVNRLYSQESRLLDTDVSTKTWKEALGARFGVAMAQDAKGAECKRTYMRLLREGLLRDMQAKLKTLSAPSIRLPCRTFLAKPGPLTLAVVIALLFIGIIVFWAWMGGLWKQAMAPDSDFRVFSSNCSVMSNSTLFIDDSVSAPYAGEYADHGKDNTDSSECILTLFLHAFPWYVNGSTREYINPQVFNLSSALVAAPENLSECEPLYDTHLCRTGYRLFRGVEERDPFAAATQYCRGIWLSSNGGESPINCFFSPSYPAFAFVSVMDMVTHHLSFDPRPGLRRFLIPGTITGAIGTVLIFFCMLGIVLNLQQRFKRLNLGHALP